MSRNTKASKALQTMRALMGKGITDETTLIAAASDALGGDETDKMVATMTWRKHLSITEPN